MQTMVCAPRLLLAEQRFWAVCHWCPYCAVQGGMFNLRLDVSERTHGAACNDSMGTHSVTGGHIALIGFGCPHRTDWFRLCDSRLRRRTNYRHPLEITAMLSHLSFPR